MKHRNQIAVLMGLRGRDKEEFLRALCATAYQESTMSHHRKRTHDYMVNSVSGDRGFMQISPWWDGKRIRLDFNGDGKYEIDYTVNYSKIDDLETNIEVGVYIFADEYRHARDNYLKGNHYQDVAEAAYAGYNGGRDCNMPYDQLPEGEVKIHVDSYKNKWKEKPWENKEIEEDIYELFE